MKWGKSFLAALLAGLLIPCLGIAQSEQSSEAKWYLSAGLGMLQFEGDEEVEDGIFLSGRIGYDWNEWWSIEGAVALAPVLDENFVGHTYVNEAGQTVRTRISQSEENPGFGDTYALNMAIDGLFHFTRWERLDPYLTLGGGFTLYGEDINGETFDPSLRAGAGVMYHFNDEWAMRGDFRTFIVGNDTEANAMIDAGVVWYWGARIPPEFVAVDGPLDSDGDGLTDVAEERIGTDPYDPDTDKDGLSDGEEVNQYKTNPLNSDTDFDGLKDGFDEVHKYGTNPLIRDTDNGGVADGHEVIEDGTDPLDPDDDLILFELNIQFDYDKAVIKSEYFGQLDVIAKMLRRHAGSTARIEGHADQTAKSSESHNLRLSKRRADAVLDYLADQGGIASSRMEAHGYGFSRPKALNDPETGNPVNRRVEVYIREDGSESEPTSGAVPVSAEPAAEDK